LPEAPGWQNPMKIQFFRAKNRRERRSSRGLQNRCSTTELTRHKYLRSLGF
jgi:hypothetical protein